MGHPTAVEPSASVLHHCKTEFRHLPLGNVWKQGQTEAVAAEDPLLHIFTLYPLYSLYALYTLYPLYSTSSPSTPSTRSTSQPLSPLSPSMSPLSIPSIYGLCCTNH